MTPRSAPLRTRGRRPVTGLRSRVMIGFGLVTVTVTGVLAVLTFQLASSYMLGQREDLATAQAGVHARLVTRALTGANPDLDALLTGLGSDVESAVLLVDDDRSITSGNLVDVRRLPGRFVEAVRAGNAVHQRLDLGGVPVLAVGLPLASVGATYVELFPLRELDRTFRFLSWMLTIGVVVSGLAGAALGRWATSRALRPLRQLTAAAARAAGGDLGVRLPERDPDLVPLARSFNATAARLQQRVMLDARFAGDVSHELRSPVTTMLNAVEVLRRRRDELSGVGASALDLLDVELSRFRATVDDLLEISRADASIATTVERLDLAEVVAHAVARAHLSPGLLSAPDEPVPVDADRRRLERVLANLLDNAERHAGGAVAVRVRRTGETTACVEVDDRGAGIPPSDRDRVFERFARLGPGDRAASAGGAGLGLALVAEHVRRHGGEVHVEDRPGGGSRFVVVLPTVRG